LVLRKQAHQPINDGSLQRETSAHDLSLGVGLHSALTSTSASYDPSPLENLAA
jgi:hypothetical protein